MSKPKRFKTLLLTYSVLALAGCAHPPPIPICFSDPKAGGFDCSDEKQKPYFLPYEKSENLIATTPEGYQKLIEWVKRRLGK